MVTLQKSGDSAVKFVFENSQHYLYGNGEIVVPVNSLLLVEDSSDMVTFKKIDGDIFISARYEEFGMSKAELEAWYKANMVSSGGGGGGIDSGTVQTMIDQSISGKTNQTDFVSHSGNTTMHVTESEKTTWNNKSDFSGSYNDLSNKPTIPSKTSDLTNDSGYITSSALNGYATEAWVGQQGYLTQHQDISGKLDVSAFNTYSGSVDTQLNSKASESDLNALNGVVTAHTANTTIHVTAQDKTNWNNKSDFSGDYNDLTNKPTIPTVPTNVSDFTNDAGYVTSTAVTQSINEAVSGKADSADIVDITGFGTLNSDTLVMTREKNGSTMIPLTVVKAGSGLTISTDAMANKSFDVDTTVIQEKLVSSQNIKTINNESILGSGNITIEGGSVDVDPSLDSGSTNAVANSAITNALHETYFYNIAKESDNKPEAKFQLLWKYIDTKQTTVYNPYFVIAGINGKKIAALGSNPGRTNFELVETSAITTSVTSSSTDAQVPSAKAVNDKLGGLSIVKLTQSEYDNLATKDNSTLYVIVN